MDMRTAPTKQRTCRARHARELTAPLITHRCEVARWALAAGAPLNLDSLSAVLGARARDAAANAEPFARWNNSSLVGFLHASIEDWCIETRVNTPRNLAESLYTYLRYLAEFGLLAAGSSHVEVMLSTVAKYGCLADDGRALTPAASPAIIVDLRHRTPQLPFV
jgi:hypothetical protein